MKHLEIFINLTRLNKPIGYMLLFWPCSWGLAYSMIENFNINLFFYYLLLFFLGSILMRSAGCVFNDIIDKVHKAFPELKYEDNKPLASEQNVVKVGKQDEHKEHKRNT